MTFEMVMSLLFVLYTVVFLIIAVLMIGMYFYIQPFPKYYKTMKRLFCDFHFVSAGIYILSSLSRVAGWNDIAHATTCVGLIWLAVPFLVIGPALLYDKMLQIHKDMRTKRGG